MSRKAKKKKSLVELLEEALIPEGEQPYEVPKNWVWTKLGIVGEYLNGRAFKSHEWSKTGRPIIRIQDLTGSNKGDPNYYEGEVEERYEIKQGDLLVSWSATLGAFIWNGPDAVLNQHIFKVNSYINKMYHYYAVENLINDLYTRTHGSGMVHVTKKVFDNTPIPLPSIAEQKRIANKIEYFLNKIDEAKQLIYEAKETFELRRAAVLDMAFRGELTANWRKENNIKFSIEVKRLEELIETGPQNGLYKPKSYYGEGTLIVRIDNFYNGWINNWETLKRLKLDEKEKSLYGLNNNDLLINRVNSIEYLGKSALVRNLTEPCVFESNVMRIKLNELVDPEYLILYLNSSKGLQELRKNAKHAVNQASINQQDVKNTVVPLPIMEEQKEIVRAVNSILHKEKSVINIISTQEKNLNLLKDSILSKAFRGELGTNDPTEESAIELIKEVLQ